MIMYNFAKKSPLPRRFQVPKPMTCIICWFFSSIFAAMDTLFSLKIHFKRKHIAQITLVDKRKRTNQKTQM